MSVHHSDIRIWYDGVGGFLPFTEKFTYYLSELLFQPKALSALLTQLVHTAQDGMWTNECMMLNTAHMNLKENEERNNKGRETWGCLAVAWWLKMIFSCYCMNMPECWSGRGAQRAWWCLVVGSFNTPPPQALFVKKKAIRGSAQD